MFHLHIGNDAAVLADGLGERLRACGRGNPLAPALVLVPQAGLRRWLQVHLAERLAVLANVEFVEPARFAWRLLRAAQPDLPSRSPFDPDVLRWHLHALLGEPLDGAALAPLRDYLQSEGDPLRRYALSGELAHAFERMQGYRREKLLRWGQGGDRDDWQAELWRRLVARVGGMSRAARVEAWLQRFESGDEPPPGLPLHFNAFACANVSPDVLHMLGIAARHCDMDFFLPLPSREYLGDAPRSRREVRARLMEKDGGNPLITSLGGAAAEFVDLLYGYEHVQPDTESDLFDKNGIKRTTLLGRVRDDILNHQAAREDERVALPDDSLQFHACHTELREVQTLHDRLLAMFAADPKLSPREIAVMMPNIAAYRPAIEAVFGGLAESDPRFIPFNLGDLPASAMHPAARLFLTLLDAPTSRWECSEILDVLSVPGVMRRFDLDALELEHLSRQLHEAGVRWGEDEHARTEVGGYREFSFAFGLDRMLAGFACGDDDEALVAGVAPLAGVEGAAFARMDALLAVLDVWRELRALSTRELPPARWQEKLNALFDRLYANDSDDIAGGRALERVRDAMEHLVEHTQAAQLQQPLAWHDLRAFLRERLNDADPRQRLFSGGVTFCGMVPLRVVPFRVICLLGMDEAAFPRRDPSGLDPLSADRRAGKRERGDRSVRDDDRLLFLQLIAAARDTLYISWIGRDARTNKERPPSVVAAELLDEVKRGYLLPPGHDDARRQRDRLLPRVQPLHAFDACLFDAAAPRSYRKEWLAAAQAPDGHAYALAQFAPAALPSCESEVALTLEALQRFFADPARGFLQRALEVHWPRDEVQADADQEPLAPRDGLLRHGLTAHLLHAAPEHDPAISAHEKLLRAQGKLPPGDYAKAALEHARERAQELRGYVSRFTEGASAVPAQMHTLTLADGTRLTGALDDLYPRGLLRVIPSKLHGRHALRAWLDALFAFAHDAAAEAWLVGFDVGDKPIALAMPPLDTHAAQAELENFVALYREGLRAPLPLFPRTFWECLKPMRRKAGPASADEFAALLERAFHRGEDEFQRNPELDESAVCTLWRGIALPGALAPRMAELARRVFPACSVVAGGDMA